MSNAPFGEPTWTKAALLPPSLPASAFVVCVADGQVKAQTTASGVTRSVWVPAGNGLSLWRAFASPADFIEFTQLDRVRSLRVTYLEVVTGPRRLALELNGSSLGRELATRADWSMSQLEACGQPPPVNLDWAVTPDCSLAWRVVKELGTKEGFFRRVVVAFIALLAPALGRGQPFTLNDFEVVDASDGTDFAFRLVAKRAVLQSKHAGEALAARLGGLAPWRPLLRVAEFVAFGATVRLVKSPWAVDNGVRRPALHPLSADGVERLGSGASFVDRDFHESAHPSFYTPTCFQPLTEAEVRAFSLSAGFVSAPEPLDALFATDAAVTASTPPWVAACEANLRRVQPHLVLPTPDRHVPGEESFFEYEMRAHLTCPAGVTHAGGWRLRLGVDADGGLSATCCAPPRGSPSDLFLLDAKRQHVLDATGAPVKVSCHARDDCCSRLPLGEAPADDLFLPATTIPAVDGTLRLPALTREERGRIQRRLGKPNLKCWLFVNPCGSGKTFSCVHAPLVEHVTMLERARKRVFVLMAFPTKKLSNDALVDIDKKLAAAGRATRCTHYDDAELHQKIRVGGVFVTCFHSLHLFECHHTVQLLFIDEVGEGALSCASTQPRESLRKAAHLIRRSEEVFLADAFAGQETLDLLALAGIRESQYHVFDTPEVRHFRDQEVKLIIPVHANTATVEPNAAVAKAVELAKAGKRVLFVGGTIEEVEVLRSSCVAAHLEVRVTHGRLTADANAQFGVEFAKEASSTTVQVFGISPLLTSGVNSWRLFDCVVASLQTRSISMAIYGQMVSRPRDKVTNIFFFVTDAALLTSAVGGWGATRVDYDAALPHVQASMQERRLVGASTVAAALGALALATLRGNLLEGVPTVATAGDAARRLTGEALFVRVKTEGWFRLVQGSPHPLPKLESVMHTQDEARRLAVAARHAKTQSAAGHSAPLVGDVVCEAHFVPADGHASAEEEALKRLWARGAWEKARRPRRGLHDLRAMFARDGRACSVEVHELTEAEEEAAAETKAHRAAFQDASLQKALVFETRMRVSEGGMFTTAQARYEYAEKLLLARGRGAEPKLPKRPRLPPGEEVDEAPFDDELAERRAQAAEEQEQAAAEEGYNETKLFGLVFKMYLSFTPAIVGEVVDATLRARDPAAPGVAAKEHYARKKAAEDLWRLMTKEETQLTFRALVTFRRVVRQEDGEGRSASRSRLLDRFCQGDETTTDKKIVALKEITILDELLEACGWSGVFAGADERVPSFMEASNPRINVLGNREEKARRVAAVRAVRKYEACDDAAKNLMHAKVRAVVRRQGPFGLSVEADATADPTVWTISRRHALWGFVERVERLEWESFWAEERLKGCGAYADGQPARM